MPHLIDGSRRKRIAAGSGTTVQQVNQLLAARKQMAEDDEADGQGQDAGGSHQSSCQQAQQRTEGDRWQFA